jgi:hypothetical protein
LKDEQILALLTERRSNRLNKIVRSRFSIRIDGYASNAADFVATPSRLLCCGRAIDLLGGYYARVYYGINQVSHGSRVCMTEYLVAARAVMILWTTLQ